MKPRNGESEFDRLFRMPDKGITEVRGVGGAMAMMVRTIWSDLKTSSPEMEKRLGDFVNVARGSVSTKSLLSYFNRSNLRREIISPKMTWKGAVKVLRILKVKSFKMHWELSYHHTTVVTRHTINIDLGRPQDAHMDDLDDEE